MAVGDLLLPRSSASVQAVLPQLDPRNAAAEALAAYVAGLRFRRYGGTDVDTEFGLTSVRAEWPEPDKPLEYPCASLVDFEAIPMQGHGLTPTALEDTWDRDAGTVLWKIAEAAFTFQLDFWANDGPTREAIAARLPSAFAPEDDGARIVIAGSSRYYGRGVRAALRSYQRMDTEQSVYPRERRLLALVRCEIDVVDCRCAPAFSPRINVDVLEPPDELPEMPALDDDPEGCTSG